MDTDARTPKSEQPPTQVSVYLVVRDTLVAAREACTESSAPEDVMDLLRSAYKTPEDFHFACGNSDAPPEVVRMLSNAVRDVQEWQNAYRCVWRSEVDWGAYAAIIARALRQSSPGVRSTIASFVGTRLEYCRWATSMGAQVQARACATVPAQMLFEPDPDFVAVANYMVESAVRKWSTQPAPASAPLDVVAMVRDEGLHLHASVARSLPDPNSDRALLEAWEHTMETAWEVRMWMLATIDTVAEAATNTVGRHDETGGDVAVSSAAALTCDWFTLFSAVLLPAARRVDSTVPEQQEAFARVCAALGRLEDLERALGIGDGDGNGNDDEGDGDGDGDVQTYAGTGTATLSVARDFVAAVYDPDAPGALWTLVSEALKARVGMGADPNFALGVHLRAAFANPKTMGRLRDGCAHLRCDVNMACAFLVSLFNARGAVRPLPRATAPSQSGAPGADAPASLLLRQCALFGVNTRI